MKKTNFLNLAKQAAEIAEDKKCRDTVILNVKKLTPIADYFLITTVESHPQMNAIINAIQTGFKDKGLPNPSHRDGRISSAWSVLDYGGIIIHIMSPQARDFYSLEKLWAPAKLIK